MYNFDEIIDRRNTNALNTDGFRQYIFKDDGKLQFNCKDDEFIRMWVADMDFAVPDVIINAIKQRLDRKILGYTKLFDDSYYNALANWCKSKYDFTFDKDELFTSGGVVPALSELVNFICKKGESVLILTPSYAPFKGVADSNNIGCVCSDLIYNNGTYTIDYNDLDKKAADEKTTLLIFCNPHNPSGKVWELDELKKVADIVKKHDMWVISDEIHCDLLRKNEKHIPLGKVMSDYKKLVTTMSASKTFNLAGLMSSSTIIRDENLKQTYKTCHSAYENPLSIEATKAAYNKGGEWLIELQNYLDDNFELVKNTLNKHLPKAVFSIPQATYLAWINLSEYFNDNEDLTMFFANNAGVLLEDGNMFVQNAEGFVRINIACPRSVLEKGLNKICSAVVNK